MNIELIINQRYFKECDNEKYVYLPNINFKNSFQKMIFKIFKNKKVLVDKLNNNRDNDFAIYLFYIGLYYYLDKKYGIAKGYFKKSIKINPNNPFVYCELANCYKNLRKEEDMMDNYLKSIDMNYKYAYTDLGKYYESHADYLNMVNCYTKAIEEGDINAIKYLAKYYFEIREYMKCKNLLLKGCDDIFRDKQSAYSLGIIYKMEKDFENMIKYYQLSYELGFKDVLIDICTYYYQLNDNERFLYYLDKDYKNLLEKNKFILDELNKIIKKNITNVDIFLKYQDYLDECNKDLFNKFIKIAYTFQQSNYKFNILEDECAICYENNDLCAIYDCHCKKKQICMNCLEKVKNCPICRKTIK